MIEQIIEDFSKAFQFKAVSLRYFNAAGAHPTSDIGEMHDPETHLIPLTLQAASGRRPNIRIFGSNYNTFDGTCIRDYIHVNDLCNAHFLAMNFLKKQKQGFFEAFNLGNGEGFSVKQVINCAQKIVAKDGKDIAVMAEGPREGDPSILVADSKKAKQNLGWTPKYFELETIIQHAWNWEKKLTEKPS